MSTITWSLDPTHSDVQFKVRHLMVSWVTGAFHQFNATVETEGQDVTTARVKFHADLSSITTNNEQRDAHLRSADFFDADNHPQIIFESTRMEKAGDDYKLHGNLTMRGVSKPITLSADFGGIIKDQWGNTRAGFSVTGKVNRKDFGVSFGMVSETGGVMLGEDVTISANMEFITKEA